MDLLNAAIISQNSGGSNGGGSNGGTVDVGSLSETLQSWATAQSAIGQETNTLLSLIARAVSEDASGQITDFQTIQSYLRAGQISRILSVGDQLRVNRLDSVSATVSGNITAAAVDAETFLTMTRHPETASFTFTYDGSGWSLRDASGTVRPVELAAYGITVTGTPAANDVITVHETASTLLWDVLGIDCDTPADAQRTHALTLGLHDCDDEIMIFDGREALFYFAEGLSAGTYNFTVAEHYWVSDDVGKTFQFTLTQEIPAGGSFVLSASYNSSIAGSTAKTYSSAFSTSAIDTVTITEGDEGTSLGSVGNSISGGTNSLQRVLAGNNNFAQSEIRQYINSTSEVGSVWSPQNVWDRVPSWINTKAGFLRGLDKGFLSVIGEVVKTTALNSVSDGGGVATTNERFFLPSRSEVYGGNEVTGGEGAAYPYYSDYSGLNAAGNSEDDNRVKYKNGSNNPWWLRTPVSTRASLARVVTSDGAVSQILAYSVAGVSPACCIV